MAWRIGKKGTVYKVKKNSKRKSRRKTYLKKSTAKRVAKKR